MLSHDSHEILSSCRRVRYISNAVNSLYRLCLETLYTRIRCEQDTAESFTRDEDVLWSGQRSWGFATTDRCSSCLAIVVVPRRRRATAANNDNTQLCLSFVNTSNNNQSISNTHLHLIRSDNYVINECWLIDWNWQRNSALAVAGYTCSCTGSVPKLKFENLSRCLNVSVPTLHAVQNAMLDKLRVKESCSVHTIVHKKLSAKSREMV